MLGSRRSWCTWAPMRTVGTPPRARNHVGSETKSPVSKTPKEKCRKHLISEPLKVQETSASEMIDIVYTLADLSPDDVNINVSPVCNGFAVKATDGNSYIMKLSAEGTLSLEQTSLLINL